MSYEEHDVMFEVLANHVSLVIHNAVQAGMSVQTATSIVVEVAGDYAMQTDGKSSLDTLSRLLKQRARVSITRLPV